VVVRCVERAAVNDNGRYGGDGDGDDHDGDDGDDDDDDDDDDEDGNPDVESGSNAIGDGEDGGDALDAS